MPSWPAAIPGVFPPVARDGRYLIDGGVAHHTGVTEAAELGATTIYVLPAGTPCALPAPPGSAIGTALHALTLLIEQRVARDVAHLAEAAGNDFSPCTVTSQATRRTTTSGRTQSRPSPATHAACPGICHPLLMAGSNHTTGTTRWRGEAGMNLPR